MINYKVYNLIKELDGYLKGTILDEEDIRVELFTIVPRDKVVGVAEEDIPEGSTHLLIESDVCITDFGNCYQGNQLWVHIDDDGEYFTDDIDDVLGGGTDMSDADVYEAIQWLKENSQGSPVYKTYKEGANTVMEIVE